MNTEPNDKQSNEEDAGQLRQAVVGGSLPPAQQFREWEADALALARKCHSHNLHLGTSVAQAMAKAYRRCAELLEGQ